MHLRPDFVAPTADGGPQVNPHLARFCAPPVGQGGKRGGKDPRRRPPPARVHQPHHPPSGFDEIDGDAIGNRDRENQARPLRQVPIGHEVGVETGPGRFVDQDLRSVYLPSVDH